MDFYSISRKMDFYSISQELWLLWAFWHWFEFVKYISDVEKSNKLTVKFWIFTKHLVIIFLFIFTKKKSPKVFFKNYSRYSWSYFFKKLWFLENRIYFYFNFAHGAATLDVDEKMWQFKWNFVSCFDYFNFTMVYMDCLHRKLGFGVCQYETWKYCQRT